MLVYIVFEVYTSTGRLLRVIDVFDNPESATKCCDSWKKLMKGDPTYEFKIVEQELNS